LTRVEVWEGVGRSASPAPTRSAPGLASTEWGLREMRKMRKSLFSYYFSSISPLPSAFGRAASGRATVVPAAVVRRPASDAFGPRAEPDRKGANENCENA